MADIRTLKLNLLADVDQFGRGLKQADKDTQTLSGKIGKYSKQMAKAFAVAGVAAAAYAVKIGVDGVKAAVEDEASQIKLAKALQNTTKATDKQIGSVETWITKQQLAYGIADTKLRPALANLARATGDVKKAQDLTNLAMDISASTGKDLETVSLALGKAYNGNIGALTKLGVPLDSSIVKTKDFNAAQDKLTALFGGAAQANTNTYAGKLAIVTERFAEMKESIGVKILPIMKNLLDQVNLVAQGFSGDDPQAGLSGKVKAISRDLDGKSGGYSLGESLRRVADAFAKLFAALTSSSSADSEDTLTNIADAMDSVASGINSIATAWNKGKAFFNWLEKTDKSVQNFLNPGAVGKSGLEVFKGNAMGGTVRAGVPTRVGEFGKEVFVPNTSGQIIPTNKLNGGGTVININGVVDAESARRSIERLLQSSARRTGAINLAGANL